MLMFAHKNLQLICVPTVYEYSINETLLYEHRNWSILLESGCVQCHSIALNNISTAKYCGTAMKLP